ncbi:MAG: hypothetical protein Q4G34_00170 [Micrococcus sp.]|nr:hypothetical protein [Micrococcus sp.]
MNLEALLTVEAGLLIMALMSLSGFLAWLWPIVRRLSRFLDDVTGSPARPGTPARLGWGARLERIEARQDTGHARIAALEAKTERVRHHVENSHTTNLRDDLDELRDELKATNALVTRLHNRHGGDPPPRPKP